MSNELLGEGSVTVSQRLTHFPCAQLHDDTASPPRRRKISGTDLSAQQETFTETNWLGERSNGFPKSPAELLEFDRTASFFDFGFDLGSVFFRDSFLEGGRHAFDHLLGFHQ